MPAVEKEAGGGGGGETDPSAGPRELAQVYRALGKESGIQVATPTLPLVCCAALDLSFHSSDLSPLPCHRNTEAVVPTGCMGLFGHKGTPGCWDSLSKGLKAQGHSSSAGSVQEARGLDGSVGRQVVKGPGSPSKELGPFPKEIRSYGRYVDRTDR